ncbi:nucleotidyltransferase family protein [Aphanizomenon sp. CS-733/32]|uniref:nucleotidyltransferase domain-containing protein n=1 Tax=Aphanizomenon sp. CS-733/32 TaxID=3021715 RepID=UPI00232E7B7A|nr:nucleotidyltransferase family protein [Aphanizomenon sp. CS-733/32]MDB9310666.1 nucleotidyltransferase family protein [Aphanizomenon sp. CS-733/32]
MNHNVINKTLTNFYQPEIELLLCCSRSYIDIDTANRINTLLQKDIDWVYLTSVAQRHNVELLLYKSLNSTYPEAVPKPILEQLRNFYYANTVRNLFLSSQLLELLNLFEKSEIPAIPYKGVVLATSVYGSPELRLCSDLDILVRQQDFSKAKAILLSHDFSHGELPTWEQPWEINFTSKDGNINVDLHQSITPAFLNIRLDFDDLWKNLELLSICSKKVRNLAPEDLLLLLCIYLTKDFLLNRERLIQICDIAETIRVFQRLNWGYLLEQAEKLGCTYILFLGIFLARQLLGTNLPEEILQRLQNVQVVKSLAAQMTEKLFSETYQQMSLIKSIIFYCRAREHLQDAVVPYVAYYAKNFISPTKTEWTLIPLPPQVYFLYYIIRPFRIFIKYGLLFLKH